MRKILLTGAAAVLATGTAASQGSAACPEDIESFHERYQELQQETGGETVLTQAEQEELESLRTAARRLHEAGNADACATVIARADNMLDSAISPQAMDADELEELELTNAQGEDLGEIEEVLIDPSTGRIAYLLVEHGGFLGMGEDVFAVPWGVARYVSENNELVLDVSEERLENAPRFSRKDRSPLGEREWAISVHSFYGVAPYWRDRRGAMLAQAETPASGDAADGREEGSLAGVTQPGRQETGARREQQAAETDQQLDDPSRGIGTVDRIEQRLVGTEGRDTRLSQQLERLTAQLGDVEQKLGSLENQLGTALQSMETAAGGNLPMDTLPRRKGAQQRTTPQGQQGTAPQDQPGAGAQGQQGSAEQAPPQGDEAQILRSTRRESEDSSFTVYTTTPSSPAATSQGEASGGAERSGSGGDPAASPQQKLDMSRDTTQPEPGTPETREVGEAGGGGEVSDQMEAAGSGAQAQQREQQMAAVSPGEQTRQQADRPDMSGKPCAEQVAHFEDRIEKADDAGAPGSVVSSARAQLRIARVMADENAEQSCLSALDRVRATLKELEQAGSTR